MTRFTFASLLVLGSATYAGSENCDLQNGYCVPFVGCAEDGTGFFYGITLGKDEGPVYAVSRSGARCVGTWWRGVFGTGKAKFTCDDGRSGRATYTYFDKTSGTATGKGRTSTGAKIRFWAGKKYLIYVLSDETETQDMIACVSEAAAKAAQS